MDRVFQAHRGGAHLVLCTSEGFARGEGEVRDGADPGGPRPAS